MGLPNPEVSFEAFKNCFVISFNLFSDETAEALADIVLPDACYLERLDPLPNWPGHDLSAGMGDWGYQIRQPAVEPLGERRHFCEVLLAFVGLSSLAGDFFVHYCIVKAGIYLPIVGELPPARSYRGRPRLF